MTCLPPGDGNGGVGVLEWALDDESGRAAVREHIAAVAAAGDVVTEHHVQVDDGMDRDEITEELDARLM